MPFPSNIAATPLLEHALDTVTSRAGAIKQRTAALIADSAAGPVDGARIVNYLRDLVAAKERLAAVASTPGLPAYAQSQVNNQALDIAAEYTTMVAQITATIDWLRNNFPKDANGYLLYEQIGAQGNVTYRTFSTATLATFRAQLAALAATIA